MAENLGTLGTAFVDVQVNSGQLDGQLSSLQGKGLAAAGVIGTAFLAAGSLITGALAGMTASAANYGDKLDEMAEKTGFSVEQLAQLGFAAEQNDSSFEGLSTGLKFLSKNLFDAATGGKENGKLFRALGVDAKTATTDTGGMNDALLKIADVFKSLPDGPAKGALAMKVFGRSGQELIPLLNQGSEGIKRLGDEATRSGVVMDAASAKMGDEFNKALDRTKTAAQGLTLSIGTELIPTLTSLIDKGNEAIIFASSMVREYPAATTATAGLGLALSGGGGLLVGLAALGAIGPKVALGFDQIGGAAGLLKGGLIGLAVGGIIFTTAQLENLWRTGVNQDSWLDKFRTSLVASSGPLFAFGVGIANLRDSWETLTGKSPAIDAALVGINKRLTDYNNKQSAAAAKTIEGNIESEKMAAELKKVQDAMADEAAADALQKKIENLRASFQASLKPADDLNKEIALLGDVADVDVIATYGDRILAAAQAQREHGFAVTGTVGRLEQWAATLKTAGAISEDVSDSFKALRLPENFASTMRDFLFNPDIGGPPALPVIGASIGDRLPKSITDTVLGQTIGGEIAARERLDETSAAVARLFAEGFTTEEVINRLGSELDTAASSAAKFGIQLNPTIDALIRHRNEAEAGGEAARAWQDHWAQAMVDVAGTIQDGFTRLGADRIGTIFADIGKNAGSVFMSAFQVQLQAPMNSLFAEWGAKLAKHMSDALGGISKSITGALGLGTGLAAQIGTAGIGMAISGALSFAQNQIGKGRRTASEFVQQTQNPFGEELDKLVSAFNRANAAGSLTFEEAADARDAVYQLIESFTEASADFASQGETQAKVVAQAQARMQELFGPDFQNILSGMDTVVGDLEAGAVSLRKEMEDLAEQMQREARFEAALKPADELNAELQQLAHHSAQDLVSVFGREIVSAAKSQREHGFAVTGLIAELEPLAVAMQAMNDATGTGWQPRVASSATAEQLAAIGNIASNQMAAAAVSTALAAAAPQVAAMNLPGVTVAQDATRLFGEHVTRFSTAVTAFEATAAAGAGIQINMEVHAEPHFEIIEGADPLVIREKVIPEITNVLRTGLRGAREEWTRIFRDTLQGITSTAIATT